MENTRVGLLGGNKNDGSDLHFSAYRGPQELTTSIPLFPKQTL